MLNSRGSSGASGAPFLAKSSCTPKAQLSYPQRPAEAGGGHSRLRSCAPAHISREISGPVSTQTGREAGRKRGIAMTKFSRSADAAEILALEHRFPLVATLIALFLAGNVGSAVLMLLSQA